MSVAYDQNKVIEEFKSVHGDRYDYSLVEYTTNITPVKIICQKHGIFEQLPKKHKKGQGCHKCNSHRKRTESEAIEEFREKHGDKYDYSDLEYKNGSSKVKIGCPVHGWFYQTASEHKYGYGCKKCVGLERIITIDEWLKDCVDFHQGKYDYSSVHFNTIKDCVDIICPIHGMFKQKAYLHRIGHNCKKCSDEGKSLRFQKIYTNEMYLEKLKDTHGDKYDYSNTVYINNKNPVEVICNIHGSFKRFPQNLIKGGGCEECLNQIRRDKNLNNIKNHIKNKKFNLLVNEETYKGFKHIVDFVCLKHGEFSRIHDENLFVLAQICPKCYNKTSKLEEQMRSVFDDLGVDYSAHNRYVADSGKKYEIDILIHDKNIGFEVNGLRYHGEKIGKDSQYHKWKREECDKKGIKLINIYENEITNSITHLHKIYRELELKRIVSNVENFVSVDIKIASKFFNINHPLEILCGDNNYAYIENGEMLACISFNGDELVKVASNFDICISKVFEEFLIKYKKEHDLTSIKSKVLLDWDDIYLFEVSGFTIQHAIEPVCWNFINGKHDKIYDNEQELILENVDRFWDTGGYLMYFTT